MRAQNLQMPQQQPILVARVRVSSSFLLVVNINPPIPVRSCRRHSIPPPQSASTNPLPSLTPPAPPHPLTPTPSLNPNARSRLPLPLPALPLPRLGLLPPAPIPLLQPLHLRLEHLGVPRVKGLQLVGLHDRRQLDLVGARVLALAVRGADEHGEWGGGVEVGDGGGGGGRGRGCGCGRGEVGYCAERGFALVSSWQAGSMQFRSVSRGKPVTRA